MGVIGHVFPEFGDFGDGVLAMSGSRGDDVVFSKESFLVEAIMNSLIVDEECRENGNILIFCNNMDF
jgi:hypothetical protein